MAKRGRPSLQGSGKSPQLSIRFPQRQYDWLTRREREIGIPVSRAVRDAVALAYPEINQESETKEESDAGAA